MGVGLRSPGTNNLILILRLNLINPRSRTRTRGDGLWFRNTVRRNASLHIQMSQYFSRSIRLHNRVSYREFSLERFLAGFYRTDFTVGGIGLGLNSPLAVLVSFESSRGFP